MNASTPIVDPGSSRQRLLDAAERLFAEHGFHGVSLRTITAEAGMNLAAANYYFGGKEGLFLPQSRPDSDAPLLVAEGQV